MNLPAGILQPTMPPEPAVPSPAVQGGEAGEDAATKTPRTRKRKAAAASTDKVEDMKLYLSEDVRFRLRMLAFKRGTKISTVANEVLDKALPRWSLERTE